MLAGGILIVYAKGEVDKENPFVLRDDNRREEFQADAVLEADYKIKLYTVLSAHQTPPNKDQEASSHGNLKIEDDAEPDWERLQ